MKTETSVQKDGFVAARPVLPEHVDSARVDAIAETGRRDVLTGDLTHGRRLHDRATQIGMTLSERDAEASRASADVQQPPDTLEVDIRS
jgi:hypothetical protein